MSLQAQINSEEKNFNSLKKEYKSATGKDWKPPSSSDTTMSASTTSPEATALKAKIDAQGDKVRQLKTSGAEKVCYIVKF